MQLAPILQTEVIQSACQLGRRVLLLFCLFSLTSCTTNPWLFSLFYDRLDNNVVREIEDYIDLTSTQKAQLVEHAKTFHAWHRQHQLPQIAALFSATSAHLVAPIQSNRSYIQTLRRQVTELGQQVNHCHPINRLTPTLIALTESQRNQLQQRLAEEAEEARQLWLDANSSHAQAERIKHLKKFGRRIGMGVNDAQETLLENTVAQSLALGAASMRSSEQWANQLIELLNQQPPSSEAVQTHISAVWTLAEDQHPELWAHNTTIWNQFFEDYLGALSESERLDLAEHFEKLSVMLVKVSQKEVDTQWVAAYHALPECQRITP